MRSATAGSAATRVPSNRALVGGEGGGCLLLVLGGVGQGGDFLELVELLDGEREVLEVFGRDAGLAFGAERHVQQGGCGGDGHVGDLLQASTRPREVA